METLSIKSNVYAITDINIRRYLLSHFAKRNKLQYKYEIQTVCI